MRFLTWLKINISSKALLDKICKRVVQNEVMETYLIQQAHVGKPVLLILKLNSARQPCPEAGGVENAQSCAEHCSFRPGAEGTGAVHLHQPHLKTNRQTKFPQTGLQSLLFENNSKTHSILMKSIFIMLLTLLG